MLQALAKIHFSEEGLHIKVKGIFCVQSCIFGEDSIWRADTFKEKMPMTLSKYKHLLTCRYLVPY